MTTRGGFRTWCCEIEPWFIAVGLANLVLGTSSILVPLMISSVFASAQAPTRLGLVSSAASLTGVVGSLIWGRLSDAAHRRKLFVVGSYAVVSAALLGMSFVARFSQLLLVNMAMNFFWVANASVTVLIVIENRDAAHWEAKIGRMNQIGALGWVLGLVLGSVALALGERWTTTSQTVRLLFAATGGIGLVASVLAARWIPRTMPRFTQRQFLGVLLAVGNLLNERWRFAPFHLYHRIHPRRLARMFRSPEGFRVGTKRFLASTFVTFFAFGLAAIPLPLLLAERFRFSSSAVFALFAVMQAAIVAAYPIAVRRIHRRGNRSIQLSTVTFRLVLFLCATLYLALSETVPAIVALGAVFFVYGFSWSFFQLSGVALTSRLAKPENQGLALGMYNALAGIGWLCAGVTSGALASAGGYQAPLAASAGTLLIALAILLAVPEPVAESEEAADG